MEQDGQEHLEPLWLVLVVLAGEHLEHEVRSGAVSEARRSCAYLSSSESSPVEPTDELAITLSSSSSVDASERGGGSSWASRESVCTERVRGDVAALVDGRRLKVVRRYETSTRVCGSAAMRTCACSGDGGREAVGALTAATLRTEGKANSRQVGKSLHGRALAAAGRPLRLCTYGDSGPADPQTAGIVAKLVEHPFDLVKVRLQSQPLDRPLKYVGPLDCFVQTLRHEGLRALWRVSPPSP